MPLLPITNIKASASHHHNVWSCKDYRASLTARKWAEVFPGSCAVYRSSIFIKLFFKLANQKYKNLVNAEPIAPCPWTFSIKHLYLQLFKRLSPFSLFNSGKKKKTNTTVNISHTAMWSGTASFPILSKHTLNVLHCCMDWQYGKRSNLLCWRSSVKPLFLTESVRPKDTAFLP